MYQKFTYWLLPLSLIFAIYAGNKSYAIVTYGEANGIPQLLGDGGGGVVFACLFGLSAMVAMFFARTAMVLYALAAVLVMWIAFLFQDNGMLVWAVVSLLFLALQVLVYFVQWRHQRRQASPPRKTRHPRTARVRARSH